ncbi:hypothetical protein INT47_005337 [Mucor saturninus]|uniref:C2H2-type domain-containing protein n=1 Tax=Mucor saturninus TaxID=64648 RepID=A0A8H7V9C7_9FUNG|nr:hypothetical protein INT47_005337 [Mucor saturninus]
MCKRRVSCKICGKFFKGRRGIAIHRRFTTHSGSDTDHEVEMESEGFISDTPEPESSSGGDSFSGGYGGGGGDSGGSYSPPSDFSSNSSSTEYLTASSNRTRYYTASSDRTRTLSMDPSDTTASWIEEMLFPVRYPNGMIDIEGSSLNGISVSRELFYVVERANHRPDRRNEVLANFAEIIVRNRCAPTPMSVKLLWMIYGLFLLLYYLAKYMALYYITTAIYFIFSGQCAFTTNYFIMDME